ncbi:MAG: DUF4956 domain-containing protein [Anaerotignum sp.]
MKQAIFEMFEQTGQLTLLEVLTRMGVASIVALVIYISYAFTHQGTIYSRKFNVTLLMLTVLTTTVMTVIGNNIALSLGMVGALSIIRFRTAVKDSRDTAYIFWTIIVGICCGVGDYAVAAAGSAIVFLLLLFLGRVRSDGRLLLIIRGNRSLEQKIEGVVFTLFDRQALLRVKNSTEQDVELIYELSRKAVDKATRQGKNINDTLYRLGGIEYVNLVAQNDEISA